MNEYYSERGITHLLSVLYSRTSEQSLHQTFSGVIEQVSCFGKDSKSCLINGIVSLLPSSKNIVELGCGKGFLSNSIASSNQDSKILGIDINLEVISYANDNQLNNSSFLCANAFENEFSGDFFIGLHACGDLSDRVLELAYLNDAEAICVPCCYSKISNSSFLQEVSKEVENNPKTKRERIFQDYIRVLLNIERLIPFLPNYPNSQIVEFTSKTKIKSHKYGIMLKK